MIVRSALTVLGLAVAVLTPAQAADFSRIGPLAPAAGILAARPALHEPALEFVYRVDGGNRPGTLTVDLARDFIAVREADGTARIHDFALRRIIVAGGTHRGFTNGSLYGLVDFFRAETYNRRMERALVEKVHVAGAGKYFLPFWVQSELQILDPQDGTPDIARREAADGVHFSYDGAEVASYTPSQQVLTPEQGAMLRKFLAFNSSLHPLIIQDIVRSGRLPQRFSVTLPPMWKKPAAVWTLQSAAATEAAYPLPADAQPEVAPSQPPPLADVLPLMQAAVAGRAPGLRSAADYRAAIETAFAQGRNFQAALTAFEFTLQYDVSAAACAPSATCHALKDIFAAAQSDPRGPALFSAVQARADQMDAAVAALRTMSRDGLDNAYVIDDFLANDQAATGHGDVAAPLFAAALKGNPYLAGYYKDLGDFFRFSFEPDAAWLCYDLGRALPGGSEAPVISKMNGYEADLAAHNPDFF